MKLPLVPFAGFAITVVTSSVLAQSRSQWDAWIDRWGAESGVYVTQRVRAEVRATASRTPPGGWQEPTALNNRQIDPIVIGRWIEKFPIIRLIVEPTPPRDYSIAVNGEDCTGQGTQVYKVPTGNAEVTVKRPGKPPCVWSGRVNQGQTQEVACRF